jgi:hypothetical protein
MSSSNSNDNSARNSVVVNVIHPNPRGGSFNSAPCTPRSSRAPTPEIEEDVEPPRERENPDSYKSPAFDDVEKEFKDQLLSFTTDILLSDVDLMKSISERGNRVLFHVHQLKQLIATLYLAKGDRKDWESLVDIETERIVSSNCFCKDCYNPFYMKIKNIYVMNKLNFLTTPFAVNLSSTFKFSLEFCLTGEK